MRSSGNTRGQQTAHSLIHFIDAILFVIHTSDRAAPQRYKSLNDVNKYFNCRSISTDGGITDLWFSGKRQELEQVKGQKGVCVELEDGPCETGHVHTH